MAELFQIILPETGPAVPLVLYKNLLMTTTCTCYLRLYNFKIILSRRYMYMLWFKLIFVHVMV